VLLAAIRYRLTKDRNNQYKINKS